MAKQAKRLTARGAANITRPGLHADGGGLYLSVGTGGGRLSRIVYFWKGKRCEIGLGSLTLVPLADARNEAMADLGADYIWTSRNDLTKPR